MRLFPRWHTPEEVARQLIEGLENGTLTLGEPALTPAEVAAEMVRLTSETFEILSARLPGEEFFGIPGVEELTRWAESQPAEAARWLDRRRVLHAQVKASDGAMKFFRRRMAFYRTAQAVLTAVQAVVLAYAAYAAPAWLFALTAIGAAPGVLLTALSFPLLRAWAADSGGRLLAAAAELTRPFAASIPARPGGANPIS